ncbi:hypothetical protein N2152v2_005863 [Parachlorella kessleri]
MPDKKDKKEKQFDYFTAPVRCHQKRRVQLAAKRREEEPEEEEEDDLEVEGDEEDGLEVEGALEAAEDGEGEQLDGEGLESSSSAEPWQPRRLTVEEMDQRIVLGTVTLEELQEWWATNPAMPLLKPDTFDYGTLSSEPNSGDATKASEQAAAAAAEPASQREHAEALLAGLPGIRREGRPEPPELHNNDPFAAPPPLKVYESPPLHSGQVPLDEWELRAIMEKRRRKEQQQADWMRRRSEIGMYPSVAADWRSDVRIRDTGDPTAPTYREWSHKEIWDLITLGGKAVDPRLVKITVQDPLAPSDAVAEGAKYVPEAEEWLEEHGMLLRPEDEEEVADKQQEEAMLASEFTDFDEEYLPSALGGAAASYDAGSAGDDY